MDETSIQQRGSSGGLKASATSRHGQRWVITGLLMAAAVGAVAAGIVALTTRGGNEQAHSAPAGPDAQSIAASFIEATYGAHDFDRAVGLLGTDVEIVGSTDVTEWRGHQQWNQAVGFTLADVSCEEGKTTSPATEVACAFSLHGLGSEELGHGPYEGTFDLTVSNGRITRVEETFPFLENGFSDEMWEPFETWVTQHHPDDAQVMYRDDNQSAAEQETELRLWRRNVAEYVAAHQ
jgi:hypothetical protein